MAMRSRPLNTMNKPYVALQSGRLFHYEVSGTLQRRSRPDTRGVASQLQGAFTRKQAPKSRARHAKTTVLRREITLCEGRTGDSCAGRKEELRWKVPSRQARTAQPADVGFFCSWGGFRSRPFRVRRQTPDRLSVACLALVFFSSGTMDASFPPPLVLECVGSMRGLRDRLFPGIQHRFLFRSCQAGSFDPELGFGDQR